MNRVFVYGTLKRGNEKRGLDKFGDATFVGEATTTQKIFSLYDLGPFPAAVMPGKSRILGEVWEVSKKVMKQLDHIEGHPEFYKRKQVATTQGTAWIYLLPADMIEDDLLVDPVNGVSAWNR